MEAQINQIFQIIETAENREISKIAAETLANKCFDNPFAIFIIFKNFLDFSLKGKLRVFDDAGFLINLILEELDKDAIKKLFETEFFKECIIKNVYQNNKFFYSFNNLNYTFLAMENLPILTFDILYKINLENIEGLYSNKAEDWGNHNSDENSKGESFGKMDLEILFPIKDEIKQEIEDCLNVGRSINNLNNDLNKQSLNLSLINRDKINIADFYGVFCEKIDSLEKIESGINLKNEAEELNKNYNSNSQNNIFLNKKNTRENTIIEETEDSNENAEKGEYNIKSKSSNSTGVKKRKIDLNSSQKIEKLEFYFNPLFFVVENFIKLNHNENWKARLCSISSLTLLYKFFTIFYYKFFKVSCLIVTNITKKNINSDSKSININNKKVKGMKKNSKEKEDIEEYQIDILIEDLKITQIKNDIQQNLNFNINTNSVENSYLLENNEFFKCENFELTNKNFINAKLFNIFNVFEKYLKENLFTNLFVNSLFDKVVDFDSEDYICIFKDLNLKLANMILNDLESEIDEMQENLTLKDLNESIYSLLNKAITNNKNNSDWQPIFSILTFLKLKMIGDHKSQTSKEDNCIENNYLENNLISSNKSFENHVFLGKNSFFNFSSSNREFSIFSLIESLMKIDSEEIINITIQILDKIMEKFNKENYNSDHINISKDKNKIISIFKNFILLINNYDDIEVGVKYYFNCLHNFIIFFKNLNEKNSSLEDLESKKIIENDLIFYALNKNKSVRIKYFNLINNILEGKLINFSNLHDFIQKNVLLAIQGLCIETDEEVLSTQKNFIINIINSNDEACLDVFFNFAKFILKLILKKNVKDSKNFFIPNNEKFILSEMEAFYSTFFVNDMQVDIIKSNYERKLRHMIPIISNVIKNRINFVSVLIKTLNLNFSEINISTKLLVFLKIYYNYLELIDEMHNKTLIIPNEILNNLINNKKLDELPLKISKKDVDSGIGIVFKFFLDFVEKYISNYNSNLNANNYSNRVIGDPQFLLEEFNKIVFIYNNIVNKRILKIAEIDDLLKIIFNKIKEYENVCNNNNKNQSENKIDIIYENFKIITNNLKKTDEDCLSLKVKIRAYASISLFNHSVYSNIKFDKISIFVNPILNCLKINSKEAKIITKNLINMVFNHTTNIDSRNKIVNLFIDNCLNSYSDEINNISTNLNTLNSSSNYSANLNTETNNNFVFNLNNPKNLKINFPLKYIFNFLSKSGKNFEMKKVFENFLSSGLVDVNSVNTGNSDNISNDESFLKKYIYFLFNISLTKRDLNFIPFNSLKSLLKQIILEEKLIDMPNLEKYIAFIIVNFSKLIDDEDENFNNTLIIDLIFNYLNLNNSNSFNNSVNNKEHLLSNRGIELIFRILNIISDSQNFQLICINYIFDVIKFINSKTEKLRSLATSLFSKLMKIISYLKLDKSYETQIINMKKFLKGLDNFSLIKNFVQQKDVKDSECQNKKAQDDFSLCIKIKENLRYYQIAGIKWLSTLSNLGLGLALCDDMGLGKTIQTLCCIANETKIYQNKFNKNPISLIICPNTLILNWIKESRKFFDESEFKLKKFEGKFSTGNKSFCVNNKGNNNNYSNKKYNDKRKLMNNTLENSNQNNNNKNCIKGPIEVFVTSYDKIRELDEITEDFFYVILDEAHIIKNPKTKLYQNIKKLNSERRIILTGTPIQNNVMELWSLFDFLMPGFLGTENDFEIKFHKKIYTNIKKLNLEEKLQENIFQSSLNDIRKRIKPFILRRLKQDVLKELPDKIIQDYICEMTPIQKDLYLYWDNIYSTVGINRSIKAKDKKIEKGKKGNGKESNNKPNTQPVLKIIDSMRKICNYPGLLLNTNESNDKETQKLVEKYKDKITDFNCSGKLKALEDILISFNFFSLSSEIINSNSNSNSNYSNNSKDLFSGSENANSNNKLSENKILIFSQYRAMLQIIKSFLEINFKSIKVKILSSDMNENSRSEIINNFNSDPDINILLLTTSIGGLGLSLTAANIVIMYDHDWNPMRDLQAMDRAHRLGQKKTVEVFR